jgi:TctA family transporter
VATEEPQLFWGVIASMWLGNLMLVLLNLPLVGIWVRMLTIPYYVLFPAIVAFSSIGVYSVNSNSFDLYTVAAFGFLGYVLVKLGSEPAPLLLGFVLGPLLEEHLRRAMIISHGDWTVFVRRPLSAALLFIAALVLVITFLPAVSRKREQVFVEEE